jgi:hypothetical protein
VLSSHPLFGLGLNNFSVYYEFVTGRTNFGPHSFYVALLVETGLVGAVVFAAFLWHLFRRAGLARRIGKALSAARDPVAADLILEVKHDILTKYVFTAIDPWTNIVVASGKLSSLGGTVAGKVAKRFMAQVMKARTQPGP